MIIILNAGNKSAEIDILYKRIEELENKLSEQSFLVNMTNILMKDGDLNTTIKSTLQLAIEITNSEAGCLYMIDSSINKTKAVEVNGGISDELVKAFSDLNQMVYKEKSSIFEMNKRNRIFTKFYNIDNKLESFIELWEQIQ